MLPHACRAALISVGQSTVEPKPSRALQPYHSNIWTSWWAWGGRSAPSSTAITPVHSHCQSETWCEGLRGKGCGAVKKESLPFGKWEMISRLEFLHMTGKPQAPSLKVFELTSQEEWYFCQLIFPSWGMRQSSTFKRLIYSSKNKKAYLGLK